MNERRAEHERLRDSMARFATLMAAPGATDHAALLRERTHFARLFNTHLEREQVEVDVLAAARSADVATSQRRAEMIGRLRADYSEHIRRWPPLRIRSDWQTYRDAVLALQSRLGDFMDWEERNLPIYG